MPCSWCCSPNRPQLHCAPTSSQFSITEKPGRSPNLTVRSSRLPGSTREPGRSSPSSLLRRTLRRPLGRAKLYCPSKYLQNARAACHSTLPQKVIVCKERPRGKGVGLKLDVCKANICCWRNSCNSVWGFVCLFLFFCKALGKCFRIPNKRKMHVST